MQSLTLSGPFSVQIGVGRAGLPRPIPQFAAVKPARLASDKVLKLMVIHETVLR
jgi:hypothetical protein